MDFTGSRIFDYDNLQDLLNSRIITRREYKTELARLEKKQAGIDKRSAIAEAKRDAKRAAKAKIAKAKRDVAKEARKEAKERLKAFQPFIEQTVQPDKIARTKRNLRRDKKIIFEERFTNNSELFIYNLYEAVKNNGVCRVITATMDKEIDTNIAYRDFHSYFFTYAGGEVQFLINQGENVVIMKPSKIPARIIRQYFAKGASHCVFQPIINKLNETFDTAKSASTKKRYAQRVLKLTEMRKKYDDGITRERNGLEIVSHGVAIEEYPEIAAASGYKIILEDILFNETHSFGLGGCGTIRFRNSSIDHIEQSYITLNEKPTILTQNKMEDMWMSVRDTDKYMVAGDLKRDMPSRLYLNDAVYALENPNEEAFEAMDKLAQIDKCKLDALKFPDVNEYIKSGRIINSWVCQLGTDKPTGHIDMPQAYTQFKKCSMYSGFMGTVHQWGTGSFDKQYITDHIGIYTCRVLSCPNAHLLKLGLHWNSTHILPSVEILYFMTLGMQFEITAGVWGSRIDFEFPEEMMKEVNGVKRYSHWTGLKASERREKKYTFKCTEDYACVLKERFGEEQVRYWKDMGVATVIQPVKSLYTTHHIAAFITSYVRIQMIDAIMKFPVQNLVRVVMDGIYFVGEQPAGVEWFKPKPIGDSNYKGFGWYDEQVIPMVDWTQHTIVGNTCLTGQGGCGKSYSVLTHTGFNKLLYVVPQHTLGQKVRKEYGCSYTTIHKLLGKATKDGKEVGGRKFKDEHYYPPVIFVDELTQIEASWIEEVFVEYPQSLIIIGGDIDARGQWFQCRNGMPLNFSKIWKPTCKVVNIPGDRRSRDDQLRQLKLDVREAMKHCFINGDAGETETIRNYVQSRVQCIKMSEAVSWFQEGDVWLAATHKTNEKLLEAGVCSGYYKKGGWVSAEPMDGYMKRGSFTTHSTQGQTIDTGRIFISVGDAFEYAMLYTAISRAVNFSQLVFVD